MSFLSSLVKAVLVLLKITKPIKPGPDVKPLN
jgi:hypothetical protein